MRARSFAAFPVERLPEGEFGAWHKSGFSGAIAAGRSHGHALLGAVASDDRFGGGKV
ncbi:hypothetical protein HOE425_332613 [Hoeflea sp. EC-HK425]|nr:hypothetical protein HOE425_332613 [Hoeflea sp. EC-HK425]